MELYGERKRRRQEGRWRSVVGCWPTPRGGKFNVLLVWACDLLARSVMHFLQVLDELGHLNIAFISFREQIGTGGAGDCGSSR